MTEKTGYFKVASPRIKLRTPQHIYVRLLLVYTCVYTLAFFLGCLLFHVLKINEGQIFSTDPTFFDVGLTDCEDIYAFCEQILSLSRRDLTDAFVLFAAGFTMLAGLAVSLTLAMRGFSLGFTVNCLAFVLRSDPMRFPHPVMTVTLFSILSAVGAAILLHLSVKAVLFSDDFKALCGRPSKIIRSKALYTHIFRFLVVFGAFLILNLIRCFI